MPWRPLTLACPPTINVHECLPGVALMQGIPANHRELALSQIGAWERERRRGCKWGCFVHSSDLRIDRGPRSAKAVSRGPQPFPGRPVALPLHSTGCGAPRYEPGRLRGAPAGLDPRVLLVATSRPCVVGSLRTDVPLSSVRPSRCRDWVCSFERSSGGRPRSSEFKRFFQWWLHLPEHRAGV